MLTTLNYQTETSVVVLGHEMGTVSVLSLQYLEAPAE